jgi:hypothetical protein
MAAYVPPGWPEAVHPPGSENFEHTAIAWLLDIVPPEYRSYGILRRHPAALASMARYHTRACLEGARQSYRSARTELAESVPPHAVDGMLAALRTEGFKLANTARSVELVEHALRGGVLAPRFR